MLVLCLESPVYYDGGKAASAVSQELLDQIEKLDERQQQQVLEYARALTSPQQATWEQWLVRAAQAQAELRAKYGDHHCFEHLAGDGTA